MMQIGDYLPPHLAEKWGLAEHEVEKSYIFDFFSQPWETPTAGKPQFKTLLGHEIKSSSEEHYKNRFLALMAKTDVLFEQRYADATHSTSNAWGVLVMAVLRGTYKTMNSLK